MTSQFGAPGSTTPQGGAPSEFVTRAELQELLKGAVNDTFNTAFQPRMVRMEQAVGAIPELSQAVQDVLQQTRAGQELLAKFAAGEISSENVSEVQTEITQRLKEEADRKAETAELQRLRAQEKNQELTPEQRQAAINARAKYEYETHHRDDLQQFATDQGFSETEWKTVEQDMLAQVGRQLPTREDGSVKWGDFKASARKFLAEKADGKVATSTQPVRTPSVRGGGGAQLTTGDASLKNWIKKRQFAV